MSKIGEKGFRAAAESPGASEMDVSEAVEPEDAELVSEKAQIWFNDDISNALNVVVLMYVEGEPSCYERARQHGR